MEFKTPTIEDKEEIDRCILADDTRSCDYATANIILWSPFYQVKYAIIDGLFVSHTDEEGGSFCYPLGKGNKKKVLQYFMDDCKEKKIPFVLHGVTHEMEEEFREIFGDIYEIEYDRDISEYIYDREKLATLSGKKLHGKRNHINRFKENHEWSYEPLSDENQLEVLAMLMEWKMQNCDPEDIEKHDEICVSKNCVINYKELGLVGRGEYELFVQDSKDEVVKRKVQLGDSNFEYVEVISGLKPGDKVVVSDMSSYKNKNKLKLK